MTGKVRAAILRRWHDLILDCREDLARLLTAEQGKPLSEALGEVSYAASFLEWFAEEAKRVTGDILSPHLADRRLLVRREPVGVVAAVTPWNFPLAMITRKAGPALAAGCTMVLKPSELTPLSALALGWFAELAGVPSGVFDVVIGEPGPIGEVLTGDKRVRKFTFTGSTTVGKKLAARCMNTSSACPSSLEATPRSLSSTTLTSMLQWRVRWRPSSAMRGRPAFAPTVS